MNNNLLVLEVKLSNDSRTKPRVRRHDPTDTKKKTPIGQASSTSISISLVTKTLKRQIHSRDPALANSL